MRLRGRSRLPDQSSGHHQVPDIIRRLPGTGLAQQGANASDQPAPGHPARHCLRRPRARRGLGGRLRRPRRQGRQLLLAVREGVRRHGRARVTVESGKGLDRAKELVGLKQIAITWFLNQYLVDKEEEDGANAEYGGFHAMVEGRRLQGSGPHEDQRDDLGVHVRAVDRGRRDLMSQAAAQRAAKFTIEIGKPTNAEMASSRRTEWYRKAPWDAWDPSKVAADKKETLTLGDQAGHHVERRLVGLTSACSRTASSPSTSTSAGTTLELPPQATRRRSTRGSSARASSRRSRRGQVHPHERAAHASTLDADGKSVEGRGPHLLRPPRHRHRSRHRRRRQGARERRARLAEERAT